MADRPAALDLFGNLLEMLNFRQGEGAAKETGALHCKIQGSTPTLGHQDNTLENQNPCQKKSMMNKTA